MQNAKAKVLGILGGLGPMATAYFYRRLIECTRAETDQEHLDVVLSGKATTPDRTAFIMGQSADDPFAVMEAEAQRLVAFGAGVIAIPCNTAHYFYQRLNTVIPVPVLNMVALTAHKAKALGFAKAGILATTGTVATGTYHQAAQAAGLASAVPTDEDQALLMRLIYEDIKAGRPPRMDLFSQVASHLREAGCDVLILGCTELSLLNQAGLLSGPGRGGPYLDSLDVLCEASIVACGHAPVRMEWPKKGGPL